MYINELDRDLQHIKRLLEEINNKIDKINVGQQRFDKRRVRPLVVKPIRPITTNIINGGMR